MTTSRRKARATKAKKKSLLRRHPVASLSALAAGVGLGVLAKRVASARRKGQDAKQPKPSR